MCCTRLAGNAEPKISQKICHLGTIVQRLSGYIFQNKARIGNRKKVAKQQYLFHMSAQYGELWHTSGWNLLASLGHPANLNGFRVLAALLHGTLGVGVSQTFQRWTEGVTYIRQGGHRVGHCSHSSCLYFLFYQYFLPKHILFMAALRSTCRHYIYGRPM